MRRVLLAPGERFYARYAEWGDRRGDEDYVSLPLHSAEEIITMGQSVMKSKSNLPPIAVEAALMPPTESSKSIDQERIRARAYEKWEAAGRPDGDPTCFWLEAEKELS